MDKADGRVVATTYDPDEVNTFQELLRRVDISSQVDARDTDAGEEFAIIVSALNQDRAADVIEEFEAFRAREKKQKAVCPTCNSINTTQSYAHGIYFDHSLYTCGDCGERFQTSPPREDTPA